MWLDRAIKWLLPREDHFFDLLNQGADCARRSTELLRECCEKRTHSEQEDMVKRIKSVEEEADRIIVNVYKELNRTFVTPIDRSDIYSLATELERITDAVYATALQIVVHSMEDLPPGSTELAGLIDRASVEVQEAVKAVGAKNNHLEIRKRCHTIKQLEEQGDQIFRTQLASMFANETNAIRLLKHKEFLEGLERTLDGCDDVANVLTSVVIKNS